jgi:hypothetical protein
VYTSFRGCGGTSTQEIYRIDPNRWYCEPARLTHEAADFCLGALAFSASGSAAGESLFFVAHSQANPNANPTLALGAVDMSNNWATLGPLTFPTDGAEFETLAGTGRGDLFVAYAAGASPGLGSAIGRADTVTGDVTALWALPSVSAHGGSGLAGLAAWRGDFYLFVATNGDGPTRVIWFTPSSGTMEQVATVDAAVVAAGASICASTQ